MPVAYHILAHREPAQVRRLVDAIWVRENTYVVHYDRRRPAREHAEIRALASGRANVLIQRPRAVLWSRFSLYAAQFEGLKLALAAGASWTHWVNLSGQCYPLAPNKVINDQLAAAGVASFIRHFQPLLSDEWSNPAARLTDYYIDSAWLDWWLRLPGLGRRLKRLFRNGDLPRLPGVRIPLPKDFTWYGGDNWVILSRSASEYLVRSPQAARISSALRHSAVAEESVFQSVILNSPLAGSVINSHRRRINWLKGSVSPSVFKEEDFGSLEKSAGEGALFARKFDPLASGGLLAKIDASLLANQRVQG